MERSSRYGGSISGCWQARSTYSATVPRRGRSECSARRAAAACSESPMVYRHSGSHSGLCVVLIEREPERHICWDDRASWVRIGNDLPRLGGPAWTPGFGPAPNAMTKHEGGYEREVASIPQ